MKIRLVSNVRARKMRQKGRYVRWYQEYNSYGWECEREPNKGELIIVFLDSKTDPCRCVRYFAGFTSGGKVMAYVNGLSEQDSNGNVAFWDGYEVIKCK